MSNQEIFGLEEQVVNVPIEEFTSERQTLVTLIIDKSGSMDEYKAAVVDGLENIKSAIAGSKQEDEMVIALVQFNNDVDHGGYQLVANMKTDFEPDGCTALYDAVVESQLRLCNKDGNGYMQTLQANGLKVKSVVVILSDGKDNVSRKAGSSDARQAIDFLQKNENIVAFITFGDEAKGIAQGFGVKSQNILDVTASASELRKVFAIISKSAISASKSAGAQNPGDSFWV